MKTVSVRYLKSGNINIDIPKEILEQGEDKLVDYCQQKLEDSPDYKLREGLSDYLDNPIDFFDETPEVEQISDIENEFKNLYSTNTWDFYSDSEYAENILAENKNMAAYLKSQGLSGDEISNICYGSNHIKRNSIEVTFVSLWDGNTEIKTSAKLDVDTGEVHSIVTQDVESYDVSILSLESIRINDIDDDFEVIRNYEDMEFAIDPCSLNKINELLKEHKVLWANEAIFHKDSSIRSFNGISFNSDELLSETKNILLDGNADWTPSDIGGLIFKKETLTSFLEDDYFDEDDKPSHSCLKEINDIVFAIKSTNSTIMYLQ